MIFALHLKVFVFLYVLAIGLLVALVRHISTPLAEVIALSAFVGACWLNFLAFREVYGEGPCSTIFKMAAVVVGYGIILVLGTALITIFAALLVLPPQG